MNLQDDLFSGIRSALRELPELGSRVLLRLEPLAPGRVRIVEYHRQRRLGERFVRQPREEGREVDYRCLGLEPSFAELFGEPDAGLADPR